MFFCYNLLKNRSNLFDITQTISTNNETKYDEINEIEVRRISDTFRQRQEDRTLFMDSRAAEQSRIVSPSHVDDTDERDKTSDEREYITSEEYAWGQECSSSNSETSSYKPYNSYINVQSNLRSSYQSPVGQNRMDNDTGSYDELTRELQNSTDYYNLRV